MKSRILFIIGLIGIIGGLTPSVWAVKTVFVEHGSEKQFKAGDPNGVVISSRGEMTLAWQAVTLLPTKNNDPSGPKTDPSWVVYALATDGDGTVYAATSGNGLIYRIASDKTTEIIYGLSDQHSDHVFSLATDLDGRLLAGTGGAAGALLRIRADGKIQTLWSDPAVKYIWSMVVGPSGRIYMGTGPEGKVITVNKEGKNPQVLFKAKEKNILALALAASGILYAGGDEYGLVYRIDPGTQKATVLYDTGQKETSSLVVGPRGDLYVAPADTNAAKPGAKLILSDG
ncbi:MAG: hypothetical protein K9M57_07400, partial [Phycisphaerae bacterium]|nr:hypothetical protein [Phycisphaerae bacterium]